MSMTLRKFMHLRSSVSEANQKMVLQPDATQQRVDRATRRARPPRRWGSRTQHEVERQPFTHHA